MGRDLAVVADAGDRLGHRIGILVDGENLGALARKQHRRGAAVAPARPDTAGTADHRHFSRKTPGHVADYPQSSLVASLAPSASTCNLAQAICGWMRPPRPQSVPAITFSRPTTLAYRTMRSATTCGCSTILVAWLTTPGISSLPSGSLAAGHP